MKVLVACEFSGVVRDAFAAKGHDACSCDLLPSERNGKHYQGDVKNVIFNGWDLMIAHPPCTDLAVSGAAWFSKKREDGRQQRSIDFFMFLAEAPIEKICVENPVCIMSSIYRKPDQIVHPYYFGDEFSKPTCFWLKGLKPLLHYPKDELFPPTHVGRGEFVTSKNGKRGAKWNWWLPPGPERAKIRSRTFPAIANAMAAQWG